MKTFTITDEIRKGIEVTYTPGGATTLFGLPIKPRALKHLSPIVQPTLVVMHWLDAKSEGKSLCFDKESEVDDPRALVLVQTAAGEGGAITLHPNTLVDRFDPEAGRVYREPLGTFPPAGVELIGQRTFEDGSEETLVVMHPGASFRIHRTGDLQGAAPQLKVCWDGTWKDGAKGGARTSRGASRQWGMHLRTHYR